MSSYALQKDDISTVKVYIFPGRLLSCYTIEDDKPWELAGLSDDVYYTLVQSIAEKSKAYKKRMYFAALLMIAPTIMVLYAFPSWYQHWTSFQIRLSSLIPAIPFAGYMFYDRSHVLAPQLHSIIESHAPLVQNEGYNITYIDNNNCLEFRRKIANLTDY
mmetsp:Transcript_18319/g.36891  ORF Transcript_18319/g.36891 Transcript_18319/m.36891 type:complete len:160 (+) Transcript_18319:86-565(+)